MSENRISQRFSLRAILHAFKVGIAQKLNLYWKDILRHWIEVVLLVSFTIHYKNQSFQIFSEDFFAGSFFSNNIRKEEQGAMNISVLNQAEDSNLANTYSNLTYTKGNIATNESDTEMAVKRRKQKAYIKKFLDIAQEEMKVAKIPASITLAQGLLESNVGESKLASKNNNHFGIKCFSKTCKRGHCSNFEDDSHKDFFRIYKNPTESYKSHSKLLKKGRYKSLYKLEITDYKGWAHGLKKAGYATDPKYAYKLINLIEDLELYQYDIVDLVRVLNI